MNTQKMKMLLVACSTLFVSQVFAEDWFVRPDIVTTAGDGHSWEGALCVSDFQMLLANELATSGDIFHLAGGSYIPNSNAENFRITQGVKLIGGYAGNLKGTDTALPVYPSATPTIFSGDRNNDGMPNALLSNSRCNGRRISTPVLTDLKYSHRLPFTLMKFSGVSWQKSE